MQIKHQIIMIKTHTTTNNQTFLQPNPLELNAVRKKRSEKEITKDKRNTERLDIS